MAKIDPKDIDNILIFSEDKWALDEDATIFAKTPTVWWTMSKGLWESLPDGEVKNAQMPCALLYQVSDEPDNQNTVCQSISVTTDGKNISTCEMSGIAKLRKGVKPRSFSFSIGDQFVYPFGMKSADDAFSSPGDVPDTMNAFSAAIQKLTSKDVGGFTVTKMIAGTGGTDADNPGLAEITESLTSLNKGDVQEALAITQTFSAEGVKRAAEGDDNMEMDVVTEPGTDDGVQGASSADDSGHGVTESFGRSTAPVPGTLLSAEGETPEEATIADEETVETIPEGPAPEVDAEIAAGSPMLEGVEDTLGGGPTPDPTAEAASPSDYVSDDLQSRIDNWMAEDNGETATHDPYVEDVPYEGPGDYSGSEVHYSAETRRPISAMIKRPGALTKKARNAGMSVSKFARTVRSHPKKYGRLTRQQASFYLNILEPGAKTAARNRRAKGSRAAEDESTFFPVGDGHILGQTGMTFQTSPIYNADEEVAGEGTPGYGQDSAFPSSQGVPVWFGSAEMIEDDDYDLPLVGATDKKSFYVGGILGIALMAVIAKFRS
jgi:hypothetical protein